MRELRGVLDEYNQNINSEFMELMQNIEGKNYYQKSKRSKYMDDDQIKNWRKFNNNNNNSSSWGNQTQGNQWNQGGQGNMNSGYNNQGHNQG